VCLHKNKPNTFVIQNEYFKSHLFFYLTETKRHLRSARSVFEEIYMYIFWKVFVGKIWNFTVFFCFWFSIMSKFKIYQCFSFKLSTHNQILNFVQSWIFQFFTFDLRQQWHILFNLFRRMFLKNIYIFPNRFDTYEYPSWIH